MFIGVEVEHPGDERPLEPGPIALEHVEARARQLHAALKIYDVQPLAQFIVRQRCKVERGLFADGAQKHVFRVVCPEGDVVVGYIRDGQHQVIKLSLDGTSLLVQPFNLRSDVPHLLDQLRRFFLSPADLFTDLFANRPEVVSFPGYGTPSPI